MIYPKSRTISVMCVSDVHIIYGDKHPTKEICKEYTIGSKYDAVYLYDKINLMGGVFVEFEWQVYSDESNHYQFTNSQFREYFIDVVDQRDKKIEVILGK